MATDKSQPLNPFAALFDTMPLGVIFQDSDGSITAANPAAERFLGLPITALSGHTTLGPQLSAEAIYEDGAPFPGDMLPGLVALRSGQPVRDVVLGLRCPPNTDYTWIRISAVPLFHAGDTRPYQVYSTLEDITERIRIEENERRERAVAEALRDSLAALTTALDVDTVMQRLLESAARVVDYEAASVMLIEGAEARVAYRHGAPAEEGVIQGTRVPLGWPRLQQIRETGTPYLVADTQQSDDWGMVPGTEWIRSSIGVPIAIRGKVIGILTIDHGTPNHFTARDVEQLQTFARYAALAVENAYHVATLETRIAERTAELQHAKDHAEAILGFTPVGILLADTALTIRLANPAFCRMYGAESTHCHRPSLVELVAVDARARVQAAVQAVLSDRAVRTLEVNTCRADDTSFVAELTIGYSEQIDSIGAGLVCALRDISERHRAEHALRASEARWQFALEGGAQGVWDWDIRTNQVFYSRQWKAMLGHTEDEVGNDLDEWAKRVHPADLTQALADIAHHLDGQTPVYENEHRVRCKDGSYKWVLDRGQVVERAPDGRPLRAIGTHTDITEHKRIEAELEKEAGLLQILMDMALRFINVPPDQLDQGITNALGRVAHFTGADRAYLFEYDLTREVMNNTHEWCAAQITPEIENLQEVPMALFPEWVSRHRSGKPMHVPDVLALPPGDSLREVLEPQGIKTLITLPLIHGTECLGFIGFDAVREYRTWESVDIMLLELLAELLVNAKTRHRNETRMKAAEARLRASEARLSEAHRIAGLGDWEFDPHTGRMDWSDEIYRTLGIAPGAGPLSLDDLRQAIHPEDQDTYDAFIRSARETLAAREIDIRIRRPNGEVRHVLLQSKPALDASGKLGQWIGTLLDVTERKQAEITLRQALAREKELGELKSRFVSVASHEFRTPLATILASAETLLAYRARLSPEQNERRLRRIIEQVDHLRTIIDDVLQFSRIETGHYQFKPEIIDLAALAREIVDEFSSHPDATHTLQFTGVQEPLALPADRNLLRQVIANLISNAVKYSPADSTVHIALEQLADRAELCVRDEGIGISEADQQHLFEPFYRATNTGAVSGTGLGLAITREAVELHGGSITVKSVLGAGTTVLVSIPCLP
jgi:PAS domain S-box-containing protein